MKRAGKDLPSRPNTLNSQEPPEAPPKARLVTDIEHQHLEKKPRTDRMATPSASLQPPSTSAVLPPPPTNPNFISTRNTNSFLDTIPEKLSEQFNLFVQGRNTHLPPLPRNLGLSRLSPAELKKTHVGLILGDHNCRGTYEIASWIASVIKEVTEGSSQASRLEKMSNLGIPTNQHGSIASCLSQTPRLLSEMQEVRNYSRLFLLGSRLKKIDDAKWTDYTSMVSTFILSRLNQNGKVLLPSDFSSLNPPNTEPGIHATSLIIEKHATNDKYVFHHFETNGFESVRIPSSVADTMRRPHQDPSEPLQRHWKFRGDDVPPYAHIASYNEVLAPYKHLLRKTIQTTLPNADDPVLAIDSEHLKDDTKLLKDLLFPNLEMGIASTSTILYEQMNVLQSASDTGRIDIGAQRIHAPQKTASCELKSTTVALSYLLDNELAYQTMIGLLVMKALEEFMTIESNPNHPARIELDNSLAEVKERIALALQPREQS